MKTIVSLFLVLFSLLATTANSQEINLSSDSLSNILCNKKWEIDYALLEGMKIYRTAEAPNIILDFKKDKTLTMNDGKSKKLETGKWIYEVARKQVKLNISGRSLMVITSISANQFITAMDHEEVKKADKGNPDLGDLKTVFKIKTD